MARRSLSSFLRPDLESELRAALNRRPDDLHNEIGRLLLKGHNAPVGLLRALGYAFLEADKKYEVRLTRRKSGRPSKPSSRTPSAEELLNFIEARIEEGELRKNAVSDAQSHFRVSRSTIYRLIAKKAQRRSVQSMEGQVSHRKNVKFRASSKRSKKRQFRRKIRKEVRTTMSVKTFHAEQERGERATRRSEKFRNIWD